MKRFFVSLLLTAMVGSTAIAAGNDAFTDQSTERGFWHGVTVYNDANYDVEYAMYNGSRGKTYLVKKGGTDVYHTGVGDTRVAILVGACMLPDSNGNCSSVPKRNSLRFYNAELIQDIHIKGVYNLQVTCVDGGSTSCLVK
jgi:hypothetical protein